MLDNRNAIRSVVAGVARLPCPQKLRGDFIS